MAAPAGPDLPQSVRQRNWQHSRPTPRPTRHCRGPQRSQPGQLPHLQRAHTRASHHPRNRARSTNWACATGRHARQDPWLPRPAGRPARDAGDRGQVAAQRVRLHLRGRYRRSQGRRAACGERDFAESSFASARKTPPATNCRSACAVRSDALLAPAFGPGQPQVARQAPAALPVLEPRQFDLVFLDPPRYARARSVSSTCQRLSGAVQARPARHRRRRHADLLQQRRPGRAPGLAGSTRTQAARCAKSGSRLSFPSPAASRRSRSRCFGYESTTSFRTTAHVAIGLRHS